MSHIAIIPARAGSKGIPGKNLRLLQGKSLVHRSLQSAVDAGFFDEVILSTDIEILLSEEDTHWIIHQRSKELCQDQTLMPPVILDVLDRRKIRDHIYVWLLQPTSPFRVKEDFFEIKELLKNPQIQSMISVSSVGDSDPSRHYVHNRKGDLSPILGRLNQFERRQDLKPVYERNGLYYVTTAGCYRAKESFFIPRCRGYLIPKKRSCNINDQEDLEYAQWLATRM